MPFSRNEIVEWPAARPRRTCCRCWCWFARSSGCKLIAPGLSVIRLSKLRPLSGRSFTSRSFTSPETEAVVVLTSGASAVTVTILGQFADLQAQIDHRLLPHGQVDSHADGGLESGLFGAHFLRSNG